MSVARPADQQKGLVEKLDGEIKVMEEMLNQLRTLRESIAQTLEQAAASPTLSRMSFLVAREKIAPTSEELVQSLLAHVEKARYKEIEKMWKQNPQLMFMEVTDNDGKKTTPLKRAFFYLDTYTWKPFYNWIQWHRPELVQEFLGQNNAQNVHVDIDALIVHGYCPAEYNIRLNASIPHLESVVSELRKYQDDLLPWHMLREMCREDGNWSEESKFDSSVPSEGGQVYDCKRSKWIDLDSADFSASFGFLYHPKDTGANYVELWDTKIAYEQQRKWFGEGKLQLEKALGNDDMVLLQLQKIRKAELAALPQPTPPEQSASTSPRP